MPVPKLGKKWALLMFLFVCSLPLRAITIKGKITDQGTNEELIGAVVGIKDDKKTSVTDLEGNYSLHHLSPGTYTLFTQYLGYVRQEKTVVLTEEDQTLVLDFKLVQEGHEIQEIEVTAASDRESDLSARKSEKDADNVMNIVSAKTIQLLPDITVASVLQRVSGVTMDRSSTGDARNMIIRGMDPRYNYTLINGVKIPSPDNKNRYIPMDIFPAEMLERIEVVKALTPSMEADAIGGATNMVLKDAPSKLSINGNLATGYSQMFFDRSFLKIDHSVIQKDSPLEKNGSGYYATNNDFPKANYDFQSTRAPMNLLVGFSIGNRFFKDRLGFIAAASYQDTYKGANSIFFTQNANIPGIGNVAEFSDVLVRQYSTRQTRSGAQIKFDYKIGKRHKITFYNVYMNMREIQARYTIDTNVLSGRTGPGEGQIGVLYRSRMQIQTIYNSTLQGEHRLLPNLLATWSALYSEAKGNIPDWGEFSGQYGIVPQPDGSKITTPNLLQNLTRQWSKNSEYDKTGYLNLTYSPKIAGITWEVSGGGMYRQKDRKNFYNFYQFRPDNQGSPQPFIDIYHAVFTYQGIEQPFNPLGTGGTGLLNYHATEKVYAGYGQLKFQVKRLHVLGGLRMEHTQQNIVSNVDPNKTFGRYINVPEYTDLLPSLHLKYALNKKQNLRASYFKGITRPALYELSLYQINNENYLETGNPLLKHTTADNFDLRYEIFPKGSDQLLIGVFYKRIQNPIEIGILNKGDTLYPFGNFYPYTYTPANEITYQPRNYGTATNYGFELAFTKFWGSFGITGNYTYTNSTITQAKKYVTRENPNDVHSPIITITKDETRPLQGQSKHIANFSLLYKNPKIGLDIQLAVLYTGRRINSVSGWYGLDMWQRSMTQLDFSVEKRIFKHFTLFTKVNNLLNTPFIVEINQPAVKSDVFPYLPYQTENGKTITQKDTYGQSYLLGIRFRFNS
jgi:TonB-dependent receptor